MESMGLESMGPPIDQLTFRSTVGRVAGDGHERNEMSGNDVVTALRVVVGVVEV